MRTSDEVSKMYEDEMKVAEKDFDGYEIEQSSVMPNRFMVKRGGVTVSVRRNLEGYYCMDGISNYYPVEEIKKIIDVLAGEGKIACRCPMCDNVVIFNSKK